MEEVTRIEINTNQEQQEQQQEPLEQNGVQKGFDEKLHASQQELNRRTNLHQEYLNHRRSNGEADSPQMIAVKERLRAVNDKLMEPMEADREAYTEQIRNLRREYDALIAACDVYIGSHFAWLWGEAKRRKNLVKRIKQSAKEEKNQLRDLMGNWQYHRDRSEGMLVGHALGHAVRDYSAYRGRVVPPLEKITIPYQPERQGYEEWYTRTKKAGSEYHFLPQPNTKDWRVTDAVGAYRFAHFMGVTNTVQAVTLAIGRDLKNEIHYGKQVMEAYRNQFTLKELRKEYEPESLKLSYSTRAICMLSQIKLFSLLMGRMAVDEEEDIRLNISDTEEVDGKTVVHIDGAMLTEGFAKGAKFNKTYINEDGEEKVEEVRLKPGHVFKESEDPEIIGQQINTLRLEFGIDDSLSDTIKVMNEEDVRYVVGDLVSKSEMRAFNQRLQYIQGELDKHATVRKDRKKHPEPEDEQEQEQVQEQEDEALWNTDKNRDVLQRRLTNGEANPVMTFGKLFRGYEVEIEKQLTDEEVEARKARTKEKEEEREQEEQEGMLEKEREKEERERMKEKTDEVREKMDSWKETFEWKFGLIAAMDADMKEWQEDCRNESVNHQLLERKCRRRLQLLDQFCQRNMDLHDRNQDISAEELDKDEEIEKMYEYVKKMNLAVERYREMLTGTILPAYADRVENLCKQITDRHEIDRILEEHTPEKEKAFLKEWKRAKKKADYREEDWLEKEKAFIKPLSEISDEAEKARKDPSICQMAFDINPKKLGKPCHTKVRAAYGNYIDYCKMRKQMVGV